MNENPTTRTGEAPPEGGHPAPGPLPLRRRDLGIAAARLIHLQAMLTPERMQGPGFAFAMMPLLRRLYPDRERLAEALVRHSAYVSTHPLLAGYVLGATARLEAKRAAGEPISPERIDAIKRALASPLAALGDPLFWVVLRPLAGLVGVLGIAIVGPADPSLPDVRVLLCPLLLLLTYNALALPTRWRAVRAGYESAASPAEILRSLPLADWRGLLEPVGAALFGALLALLGAGIGAAAGETGADGGVAAVLPLAVGFAAARLWLRRAPTANVEAGLAVLAIAAAVSLAV